MQIISEKAYESRDRNALSTLLNHCQELARKKNQMQILSISLKTKYMDPLAVLESIYEPHQLHFYLEHPVEEEAIAGAESVVEAGFDGPDRFDKVRDFSKNVLDNTLSIGDLNEPFTGPHFFTSFTFFNTTSESAFPAARVFLPFWQVARKGGNYSAVANIPVFPNGNIELLAERVWAAYNRFNEVSYDGIPVNKRADDSEVFSSFFKDPRILVDTPPPPKADGGTQDSDSGKWGLLSPFAAIQNIGVSCSATKLPITSTVTGPGSRSWRGVAGGEQPPAHQELNTPTDDEIKLTTVGEPNWYQEAVKQAVQRIKKGEFQKIVLARSVDLKSKDSFDPMTTLGKLREKFPLCFICSVANAKGQSFIAAAPERLLKIHQGKLKTEAVAGSAPRGSNMAEDAFYGKSLLESEKDVREHQFVIDSIVKHLQSLGIQPQFDSTPRLKKLANVQHLNTPIEAQLSQEIHFLDVAKLLHPTPAVGGTPLAAARNAIAEIENFDRGLYAGAIGWFNYRGDGELVVGIRSALIEGNQARVYAGSGIVQGSDPHKEMRETEIKLQAILQNLR